MECITTTHGLVTLLKNLSYTGVYFEGVLNAHLFRRVTHGLGFDLDFMFQSMFSGGREGVGHVLSS